MELPREFSLFEVAAVVGGKVGGNGDTKIKRVAFSPLQSGDGDLALFFEPKLLDKLSQCKATAVLVPEGVECSLPHVAVKRPQLALQKMLTAIQPKRYLPEPGVHPTAFVDPTAELADGVAVGPKAVIGAKTKIGARTIIGAGCLVGGQVTIGENCLLHQGSMVSDYCRLGNRVILQQGASIGGDGFSYVTERPSNMELRMSGVFELSDEPNPLIKIPNIGNVVVEDDVEVGSNTTIDRATMGSTVIGAGTKIDNLAMIAHNCRLGKEVIMVGMAALAGSCTVGDRAVLAGQVGVKDHIKIGKDAIIQAQAGVMADIEPEAVVVGSPAVPMKDKFEQIACTKKLPKMTKEFREMKRKIEQLEKALLERQLESTSS